MGHQWAYLIFKGPVPEGFRLDHICHLPDGSCPGGDSCPHRACCNPEHLVPAAHVENVMRGLGVGARNARKTHCIRGHPFDDANTRLDGRGARQCRECERLNRQRPGRQTTARAWRQATNERRRIRRRMNERENGTEQQREARREYLRRWRAANADKVAAYRDAHRVERNARRRAQRAAQVEGHN